MSLKLKLSSKAKTLKDLQQIITEVKELPLLRFFAFDYLYQNDLIIKKITNSCLE